MSYIDSWVEFLPVALGRDVFCFACIVTGSGMETAADLHTSLVSLVPVVLALVLPALVVPSADPAYAAAPSAADDAVVPWVPLVLPSWVRSYAAVEDDDHIGYTVSLAPSAVYNIKYDQSTTMNEDRPPQAGTRKREK